MYKHILIPTDGTELGTLALKQGLAFAKGIGAKVTCVTAYPPFHTFSMEADMLADSPALYRKNAKADAKKLLDQAAALAKTHAVPCDTVAVTRLSLRGDPEHRPQGKMRSDCHGLAWPARPVRRRSRVRDPEGPHPLDHSGHRLSLIGHRPRPIQRADMRRRHAEHDKREGLMQQCQPKRHKCQQRRNPDPGLRDNQRRSG